MLFRSDQQIKVHAWMSTKFVQSNIISLPNDKYTLYSSNPDRAHEKCTFRLFKNYHMIRGKIYKCGPVALMPEFDSQHELKITDQDRALLNSYRPFSAQDFADHSEQVLRAIKQPLPQCKFCPGSHDIHRIAAQPKARATTINIIKRS